MAVQAGQAIWVVEPPEKERRYTEIYGQFLVNFREAVKEVLARDPDEYSFLINSIRQIMEEEFEAAINADALDDEANSIYG